MSESQVVKSDCAAGRAYHVLKAAAQLPGGEQIRSVWGQVFGVPAENWSEIRYRLAMLIATIGEAQHEFHSRTGGEFADPFPAFINALAQPNLDQLWNSVLDVFSREALGILALAANYETNERQEVVLEADQLGKWSSQVEKLLKEVLDADIDETLKQTIVEHLNAIKQALIYYKLSGVQGLRKAVYASIGALMLHCEEVKAAMSTNEGAKKGPIGKVIEFLTVVGKVIRVCKDLKTLLPAMTALMLDKS